MATLSTIVNFLDTLLDIASFQDMAINGLQVDAGTTSVKKVAVAVDAGKSVIERAIALNADLLIVHHGLLWDAPQKPLSGVLGEKIRLLIENRCSLYASHLPLDAHPTVGNGFELGRTIGLEGLKRFGTYRGQSVGAIGTVSSPRPLSHFIERCALIEGASPPLALPFGKEEIRSVAIVTGSGAFALPEAKAQGADLLISGEPKQEAYHLAKELHIHALFAGHYATETFGVRALGRRLEKDYDIEALFVHEPTNI